MLFGSSGRQKPKKWEKLAKSEEVSPTMRRVIRMKGTRGGSSRAMKS